MQQKQRLPTRKSKVTVKDVALRAGVGEFDRITNHA